VKRILKALTYIAAGLYLLVDAIFMTLAKAHCQVDRQACTSEEIKGLDQILAALSISRFVLHTGDRA
jgi:hypothetical protein